MSDITLKIAQLSVTRKLHLYLCLTKQQSLEGMLPEDVKIYEELKKASSLPVELLPKNFMPEFADIIQEHARHYIE